MKNPKKIVPQNEPQRDFYSRGKPGRKEAAPRHTYRIKKLWQDLNERVADRPPPYDVTFTLIDTDINVTVRAFRSDRRGYTNWSIAGGSFILDDCAGRADDICDQLELALLEGG